MFRKNLKIFNTKRTVWSVLFLMKNINYKYASQENQSLISIILFRDVLPFKTEMFFLGIEK